MRNRQPTPPCTPLLFVYILTVRVVCKSHYYLIIAFFPFINSKISKVNKLSYTLSFQPPWQMKLQTIYIFVLVIFSTHPTFRRIPQEHNLGFSFSLSSLKYEQNFSKIARGKTGAATLPTCRWLYTPIFLIFLLLPHIKISRTTLTLRR